MYSKRERSLPSPGVGLADQAEEPLYKTTERKVAARTLIVHSATGRRDQTASRSKAIPVGAGWAQRSNSPEAS
jgi:hypothetical protein